ncbi:hypothetical protein SNE40_021676 [Patella caerulea]|uniref:Tetraspanin n=1 Tax=Patella caerulea TaxID=87958 RepID=A0AAN8G002_PATCE
MCPSLKSFLKFSIVAVNVPILIIGLVSLGTGIWVVVDEQSFFKTYSNIIDLSIVDKDFIKEGAIVLLSAGTATALFALVGIAAARSNSVYLLGFYIIMLCMLIGIEVAAVTLGIIFKERWERKLDADVLQKIEKYYDGSDTDGTFSASLNLLQQQEKCCGWRNGTDFTLNNSTWNKTMSDGSVVQVPATCCFKDDLRKINCMMNPNKNNSNFETGCKTRIEQLFINYQGIVIGLGVCILTFEMLMVVFSICLLTHTVSSKYDMS